MIIENCIYFDGTKESARHIAAVVPFEVYWDEHNGRPRLRIEQGKLDVYVYAGEYLKIPYAQSN
jgi:hypothetical protein